jgi:hypothetical protein
MSPSNTQQPTPLSSAVELGWRLAELYALVDDTGTPTDDTLLPAHASLDPADQLELQVRAAAGDARRAGIFANADQLEELVGCARQAHLSDRNAEEFRRRLRTCHIELQKELWAGDEALGKAYELGNGLSDTYGRICRAYREGGSEQTTIWGKVFKRSRIERLKLLLDDLQSRLDPAGVTVVKAHLDTYQTEVPQRIEANGLPELSRFRSGLRRQTITWRQLVGGEKEPEAYLDRNARVDVRADMRKILWQRLWRWIPLMAAGVFVVALSVSLIVHLYGGNVSHTGIASALTAVVGALGITKASVAVAIRSRLHQWSELVWNRALAARITAATLFLDQVLDPAKAARKNPVAKVAAKRRERVQGLATAPGPAGL